MIGRLRYTWDPEEYARAAARMLGSRMLRYARDLRWKLVQRGFELRNRLYAARPVRLSAGSVPVWLVPVGATATDVWWSGRYERHELGLVLRGVQDGTTFLDVGANAGIYALAVAARYPDVHVVAVEPAKSTFEILQRNVRLNGLSHVTLIHAAIAEYEGQAELQVNAAGKDGLNTLGAPTHPDSNVVSKETVPVLTLDKLVRRHDLRNVSAIKVDVEGGELAVFNGGQDLLRADDAPFILFEGFSFCTQGFGYHPVTLVWLLESWGYVTLALDSVTGKLRRRGARNGRYDSMYIAIKPGHPFFDQAMAEAGQ